MRLSAARRERGAVLPFVAVALLAMLAMGALALDMGHAYVNKTRLQNVLDAAALAGAKVLDETGDTLAGEAAAREMFTRNAAQTPELVDAAVTVTVQFSNTLNPFAVGSAPAQYIRVRADGFSQDNWIAQLVGQASTQINGSAVAGPTPTLEEVCDIAPMMACGDPGAENFGYTFGEVQVMKTSSSQGSNFDVGPGNFQLIRLDDSAGGADVRDAMAGDYNRCVSADEVIETEPGNTVGPVVQGLNTRFGIYQGPMDQDRYRPDLITTHAGYPNLEYEYTDYQSDLSQYYSTGDPSYVTNPEGAPMRRMLTIPFGDCTGTTNGQGQVDLLGYGCFFLLDPVQQKGNESEVYGQFVETCGASGMAGPNPGAGPGPHKIVLHKDPDSIDS